MTVKRSLLVLKATLVLLSTACIDVPDVPGLTAVFRERLASSIDKASYQITEGADVFTVLDWLEPKLESIENLVYYSVPFIRSQAERAAIVTTLCLGDILSAKVLYGLQQLKAELITGEILPPPSPHICSASLSVLDLNAPEQLRRVIEFYGDFPSQNRNEWDVYFYRADSTFFQVTGQLHFQSPYVFNVNLSGFPDAFLGQFQFISVQWDSTEVFAASIIPKDAAPVENRIASLIFPSWTYVAPHFYGDQEFDGNGPEVYLQYSFRISRNRIFLKTTFMAVELGGDHSTAFGVSEVLLYVAPQGWHIQSAYMEEYDLAQQGSFRYIDTDPHDDIFYTGFGQFAIRGDGEGNDISHTTGFDVHFTKATKVTLAEGI